VIAGNTENYEWLSRSRDETGRSGAKHMGRARPSIRIAGAYLEDLAVSGQAVQRGLDLGLRVVDEALQGLTHESYQISRCCGSQDEGGASNRRADDGRKVLRRRADASSCHLQGLGGGDCAH
jgi:hypothetical protein